MTDLRTTFVLATLFGLLASPAIGFFWFMILQG
jgi:hypothetical protein